MIEKVKNAIKRIISKENKERREDGFSLLEYAAGAAVLAGIVYAAMFVFGQGLESFFTSLGDWATQRAGDLNNSSGSTPPTP